MIFCFRPCNRRTRWRRRRPDLMLKILVCLLGAATAIGLLFLSPQWLLVAIIIALLACLCVLIKR